MKLKVKEIIGELTNNSRGKQKLEKQVRMEWRSCARWGTDYEDMPMTRLRVWELELREGECTQQERRRGKKRPKKKKD